MPLTGSVEANMHELKQAHPEWPRKRRIAASLNAARRASADIPLPKGGTTDDAARALARKHDKE